MSRVCRKPAQQSKQPLPFQRTHVYPLRMRNLSLGLDFGTTNTVVSLRRGDETSTLAFDTRHGKLDTVRTVLAMWQDPTQTTVSKAVGRDALAEFTEFPEDTRLIQSLKSYAANPLFRQAMILNRPYTFAELMREFLMTLFGLSNIDLASVKRLTIGRPVHFAGYQPNETLALKRYSEVFTELGISDIEFVYEPVAAAHTFARRLNEPATVLIADLGGGTTDFSVLRLAAPKSNAPHAVLGVGGIGIAGDQFDYRIIINALLPHLGSGTCYTSMGKTIELPSQAFTSMARWNELSFLRLSREYQDLKSLARYAEEPKKLSRFFDIVDHGKSLALYDAVSSVKRDLSQKEDTVLIFGDIRVGVTRNNFEAWIKDDLQRISNQLDATLKKCELKGDAIDSVFLTGGTSLVPAVRQLFADRFGDKKIEAGDELVSVAKGLSEI
jgi:hypothetical chaperone protein